MGRLLVSILVLFAGNGCLDETLFSTDDAGVPQDTEVVRLVPVNPSDPIIPDRPDAGVAPAPTCLPWETLPIPWTCEDDVDWCDDLGDAPEPEGDLLATWSHVEGDEFVLSMRFSAMPFTRIVSQTITTVFPSAPGPFAAGHQTAAVETLEPYRSVVAHGAAVVEQGPNISYFTYPPSAGIGSTLVGVSACSWGLHPDVPLVELRVPLSAVTIRDLSASYAISVSPCLAFPGGGRHCEVSWPVGAPQPLATGGGRPDEADGIVSFCDLSCPQPAAN